MKTFRKDNVEIKRYKKGMVITIYDYENYHSTNELVLTEEEIEILRKYFQGTET